MTDRQFFALMGQLARLGELVILVNRNAADPDVDTKLKEMQTKADEEPQLPSVKA